MDSLTQSPVPMNEKALHWIFYIGITLSFVVIGAFFYLYINDEPPITYANGTFDIDKPVYKRGEKVYLDINLCADYQVEYGVVHFFKEVDREIYSPLPRIDLVTQKGCYHVTAQGKQIPEDLELGRYIIISNIHIPGFFQQHVITKHTKPFEVVE